MSNQILQDLRNSIQAEIEAEMKAQKEAFLGNDVRMVVLQRGWILVGIYNENGDEITVSKSKSIRNWGTTKGLGEITKGPTSKTILDEMGFVQAHKLTVVLTLKCEVSAWLPKLG